MTAHSERGIAIVLALFLMAALSVLGASLMFLSQTETYASLNYRLMSQARYGAEAGVQRAANFLLDNGAGGQYQVPTPTGGTDPITGVYDLTKSPVTLIANGLPVILVAGTLPGVTTNYPVAAVQTAYSNAVQGTLAAGSTTVTYGTYATLISMQVFDAYGGTQGVVQTWEVVADGGIANNAKATVEVAATIATPKVSANSYAAFATANTCGALQFQGNVRTDSYDSTGLAGGTAPTTQATGGDVGTNGNLTIGGHADVQGNLYSPRTGVGACSDGSVTALTESGAATVSGSVVQLPNTVTYPAPVVPSPSALPAVSLASGGTSATTCALLGLTPGTSAEVSAGTAQCNVTGSTITINGNGTTLSLPTVDLSSHVDIVLVAAGPTSAQYNFNSIQLTGGSTIGVSATSPTQSVLVNVVGKDNAGGDIATPIDFTGGTFTGVTGCATCSTYDASMLQIVYGGSGNIVLTGNSGAAATIYAPNAAVEFRGTADLYGSILARTLNETGSGNIHYDRRLSRDFWVRGNPMIGTFTWKRF